MCWRCGKADDPSSERRILACAAHGTRRCHAGVHLDCNAQAAAEPADVAAWRCPRCRPAPALPAHARPYIGALQVRTTVTFAVCTRSSRSVAYIRRSWMPRRGYCTAWCGSAQNAGARHQQSMPPSALAAGCLAATPVTIPSVLQTVPTPSRTPMTLPTMPPPLATVGGRKRTEAGLSRSCGPRWLCCSLQRRLARSHYLWQRLTWRRCPGIRRCFTFLRQTQHVGCTWCSARRAPLLGAVRAAGADPLLMLNALSAM